MIVLINRNLNYIYVVKRLILSGCAQRNITVDRITNKRPHLKNNCKLACHCNITKKMNISAPYNECYK